MSRLVLKMPYIKGGAHAGHNMKYIATREGVDKSINFNVNARHRANNIEYIATRPRAVRVANHGLFGNEDTVNLNRVKTEVANHKGNIWTGIISLRREDAERTGYNNPMAWRILLCSKQMEFAKNLRIPIEDFRWCAAFHDEKHHPHVHVVMYSAKPSREYLTKKGIENMKSTLTRAVFQNELQPLYIQKTKIREQVALAAREKIQDIKKRNITPSPTAQKLFAELSYELKNISGKKTYSYLPKPQKKLVDELVSELAKDCSVDAVYKEWCKIQKSIIGYYHDKEIDFEPLWEQPEFKKIKNMVIKEAVNFEKSPVAPDVSGNIFSLVYNILKMLEGECEQEINKTMSHSVDRKTLQEIAIKKMDQGMKF